MPQVPLTREQRLQRSIDLEIAVDPENFHLLEEFTWNETNTGQLRTTRGHNTETGVSIGHYIHHFVIGKPKLGLVVDHIDRNPRNNRLSNLRFVNRQQNVMNSDQVQYAANIYPQANNTFYVLITRHKKRYYLGTYDTIEECIDVRDAWLAEYDKL